MILRQPSKITKKETVFWAFVAAAIGALFFVRLWQAGGNDFTAYYNAGLRSLHGLSPYRVEETPFRYLPATAFFFIPFTIFNITTARLVFFLLNFAAVIAIYSEIRKRVGVFATVMLMLFFFRFHNHDFSNSQINPLLLVLFFYWWKNREKDLVFSTLAFAVFGSFKLLPFVLGLPLLARGRWKEIQWIALWTVILNFLPIFFYTSGPLIFQSWYDQAKEIGDPVMLSNVQSLQAALWWLIEGHLSPGFFAFYSRGLQLVLLLAIIVIAPRRNREAWILTSTLALTALIAPLAWKHNYLQFLPLVFLWFREDPEFKETRTQILYGLGAVGMVILPSGIAIWNRIFSDRLYLMVWTGILVIFLGLALARRAEKTVA